ncbi:MAG: hypothetical protein GX258_01410 [Clostridiales bacterium]|nr:hypothetical protein [Clostridiales bacterium]
MAQSWSGIRKILENDLLCDSLRGRVQYFITKYTKAHDESGRVAVRVDGIEILKGNEFIYYKNYLHIENALKMEMNIPRREWNGKITLYEEENRQVEDTVEEIMIENGHFHVWQFTDALKQYRTNSIQDSLTSSNYLVRMFAIMDRRVGKRTLHKLKEEMHKLPEWLQFFYKLRFEADNLLK